MAMDTLRSHKVRSVADDSRNRDRRDKRDLGGFDHRWPERLHPEEGGIVRRAHLFRVAHSASVRASAGFPRRSGMRKYIQATDAQFVRDDRARLFDFVTTFGTRAFFFGDSNDIRYGSERSGANHRSRRGTANMPTRFRCSPCTRPVHLALRRGAFAQVIVLGAADIGFAVRPTWTRSARWSGMNGREYEVIGVFEQDPGLFGGPGVDQFAVIPFSLFHKQYPESKELILAFTVPKDVNPDSAKDEVTKRCAGCGT